MLKAARLYGGMQIIHSCEHPEFELLFAAPPMESEGSTELVAAIEKFAARINPPTESLSHPGYARDGSQKPAMAAAAFSFPAI